MQKDMRKIQQRLLMRCFGTPLLLPLGEHITAGNKTLKMVFGMFPSYTTDVCPRSLGLVMDHLRIHPMRVITWERQERVESKSTLEQGHRPRWLKMTDRTFGAMNELTDGSDCSLCHEHDKATNGNTAYEDTRSYLTDNSSLSKLQAVTIPGMLRRLAHDGLQRASKIFGTRICVGWTTSHCESCGRCWWKLQTRVRSELWLAA